MIHLVPDEGVDNGPVLATREIFFEPGETLEAFEQRVHKVEHALLVETLKKVVETK
jgi:folate-dependent phosphoribosylglycinamide formyltransferase PurN